MTQLNSPVEILKLLNKSNCKECGQPTCLAFAAAVARGQKKLEECPYIEPDILEQYDGVKVEKVNSDQEAEETLEALSRSITRIDLSSAAKRIGAKYSDGKLTIKIMGKDFSIDSQGNFFSEIHIHQWIAGPVIDYILNSKGTPVSGNWVPFRELKGSQAWERFFVHRCEKPLKKVADTYTDLFHDMLHVFSGKEVEKLYDSDISLVLYPLPKFPVLICYWEPEDGMESSLNLFFDSAATDHLRIESIYALMTGLVIMFEKVAVRHGG
jgi:hypothetical protein